MIPTPQGCSPLPPQCPHSIRPGPTNTYQLGQYKTQQLASVHSINNSTPRAISITTRVASLTHSLAHSNAPYAIGSDVLGDLELCHHALRQEPLLGPRIGLLALLPVVGAHGQPACTRYQRARAGARGSTRNGRPPSSRQAYAEFAAQEFLLLRLEHDVGQQLARELGQQRWSRHGRSEHPLDLGADFGSLFLSYDGCLESTRATRSLTCSCSRSL